MFIHESLQFLSILTNHSVISPPPVRFSTILSRNHLLFHNVLNFALDLAFYMEHGFKSPCFFINPNDLNKFQPATLKRMKKMSENS